MKRRFLLFALTTIVFIIMAQSFVFGAVNITQKNIDDGLSFCASYPVGLTLDGEKIEFDANDVPTVIITPTGEQNGRTLIPARALFEAMGGTVTWIDATRSVEVSIEDTKVVLTIDSQTAYVNNEEKVLEVPALVIDHDKDGYGSTMIPVRFTAEAFSCSVSWVDATRTVAITSKKEDIPVIDSNDNGTVTVDGYTFPTYNKTALPVLNDSAKSKILALDMGHGGKDSGAIGHENKSDELYEKVVNLAVGLKIRDYLQAAGLNVVTTRDSDTYLTLLERAAVANDAKADFFVSIHNNSSDYAAPNGTEVHYYSKVDTNGKGEQELYGITSKAVAQTVEDEMVKALGTYKRGINSSPKLAVLNKTSMPAIIIEGAFISNEDNFNMMKTEEYKERYAYACAKAIITAFNEAFK